MSIGQQIKAAREARKWSQGALARAAGCAQSDVFRIENDLVETSKHTPAILAALGLAPTPYKDIPIVGYIGAGATVFPIDDHEKGDGFDTIPTPPGVLSGVALIVRGDSMWPKYEDGEIIVCEKSQIGLESLIGRTCYVQLSDGRALLKIITRGSAPGYWTLNSHNAPPIEDVVIERAYPIAWTKPRR